MLTTLPKPRSTMPGSTALATRRQPLRLISITRSQNCSSVSRKGRSSSQPALLTTISTWPSAFPSAWTPAATESPEVTSSSTASARPPASDTADAVSSAVSSRRSATAAARYQCDPLTHRRRCWHSVAAPPETGAPDERADRRPLRGRGRPRHDHHRPPGAHERVPGPHRRRADYLLQACLGEPRGGGGVSDRDR